MSHSWLSSIPYFQLSTVFVPAIVRKIIESAGRLLGYSRLQLVLLLSGRSPVSESWNSPIAGPTKIDRNFRRNPDYEVGLHAIAILFRSRAELESSKPGWSVS